MAMKLKHGSNQVLSKNYLTIFRLFILIDKYSYMEIRNYLTKPLGNKITFTSLNLASYYAIVI